jgi:hypothetical protein
MWDFLTRLFKKGDTKKEKGGKSTKKTPNPHINQSDEIRKYAKTHFVIPARKKGDARVSFTARDIHEGLDLASRYPMVCSAIDSKKFAEFARIELTKRDGPQQGATAHWTFKVL